MSLIFFNEEVLYVVLREILLNHQFSKRRTSQLALLLLGYLYLLQELLLIAIYHFSAAYRGHESNKRSSNFLLLFLAEAIKKSLRNGLARDGTPHGTNFGIGSPQYYSKLRKS